MSRAAPSAPPPAERIYVRLPNWVGDVVMATPPLRALRRAYPRASITAGMRAYVAPVLRGFDAVDDVLLLDRGESRPFGGLARHVRALRDRRFDAAFLFTNSFGTALGPALARIPTRAGYAGEGRRLLLTHAVPRRARKAPIPMPELYGRVLRAAGVPFEGGAYELPVLDDDRDEASRRLARLGVDPTKPLIALVPGAKFGASKLWAPERFAAAADALAARFGAEVAILSGPGEGDIARRIVAAARSPVRTTHDDVAPLGALRGIVERCCLMLCNDTGPRFFAAALNKPLVCVMGSTHPGWSDWAMERQRVVRVDVPCGPCHLKTCPLDHACMTGVRVDAVVRAAEDLAPSVASEAARVAARFAGVR